MKIYFIIEIKKNIRAILTCIQLIRNKLYNMIKSQKKKNANMTI